MRILLVNKFHYRKGGAETYYLTVGSELERMGHEVAPTTCPAGGTSTS